MRRCIKLGASGARIITDPWTLLEEQATQLPGRGKIIAPLALWRERSAELLRRGEAGVQLPPDAELTELLPQLSSLPLVAIDFPRFTDGRGFSLGRLLRQRHGFKGELRAAGHFLLEQLYYLQRCGFDAFCPEPPQALERALEYVNDFRFHYQEAADGLRSQPDAQAPHWESRSQPSSFSSSGRASKRSATRP